MPGSISFQLDGEGAFFCSWHYECVGHKAKNTKEEFLKWWEWITKSSGKQWIFNADPEDVWQRLQGFEGNIDVYKPKIGWDERDTDQIKGLVALGKDSTAWKLAAKANPKCIEEAEKLIASGWEPKNNLRINL